MDKSYAVKLSPWTDSFLSPEELPSSNGAKADNGLELIQANLLYWRGGGSLQA